MKIRFRVATLAGLAALCAMVAPGMSFGTELPTEYRLHMAQVAHDAGTASPALPATPSQWPRALELGIADSPGGATEAADSGFSFRYQYLAGGVNSGNGWATWNPGGTFVSNYIGESAAAGLIPVFSYYMIRQSLPGAQMEEAQGVRENLVNAETMMAYLDDLELFFRRAADFPTSPVVLHFEPDLWGFLQQSADGGDVRTAEVAVASSGQPFAAGRTNTAAGLAQTVVAMRNALAPNVILGYHLSWWGTGEDPTYTNPSDAHMLELAEDSAAYYQSLNAAFDVIFMEFSDRDAAFKQYVNGDNGASWWDTDDFRRHRDFIRDIVALTGGRVVLWQIPLGNTKMQAMNNTWNHFQDNRVEWLLGDAAVGNLTDYVEAGVIGLLFGRGADGATCACDANGDGVTNPEPLNGNDRISINADDDGGYFRERTQAYLARGPLPLP